MEASTLEQYETVELKWTIRSQTLFDNLNGTKRDIKFSMCSPPLEFNGLLYHIQLGLDPDNRHLYFYLCTDCTNRIPDTKDLEIQMRLPYISSVGVWLREPKIAPHSFSAYPYCRMLGAFAPKTESILIQFDFRIKRLTETCFTNQKLNQQYMARLASLWSDKSKKILFDIEVIPTVKTLDGPVFANKMLLSLQSPVFANMFAHKLQETSEKCVLITEPDIDREALQVFVDLVCIGNLHALFTINTCQRAFGIYRLLNFYNIEHLKQSVIPTIIRTLELSIIEPILLWLDDHKHESNEDQSIKVLQGHIECFIRQNPEFTIQTICSSKRRRLE